MPLANLTDIKNRVGEEVGVSDWIMIDQARIDAFAEATEDRQFIHVDAAAAAKTPFGGTIAHGFLTLSLLSRMAAEAMLVPDGVKMAVNYGLDRVRFLAPVKSGKRVRGRFTLDSLEEKAPGQWLFDRGQLEGPEGLAAVVISTEQPGTRQDHPALLRAIDDQLRRLLPGLPAPAWLKVIAERRATYACTAGLKRPRPGAIAPRLDLAGDYTDPEFPATLEAAARSGVAAARELQAAS